MFYENLETILRERKSNINQFAKEIGMKQQTMAKWKNGAYPTAEKVKAIAEYLNISADYLLDIEIQQVDTQLNAQEQLLIKCYRSADERGKKIIQSIAKQEAEIIKEKEILSNSEAS